VSSSSVDIYSLLVKTEKEPKVRREEILHSLGVSEEYFEEGRLTIDRTTCRGVECKLCIKACPTSALYWDEARVKLEKELCIYCSACVLSCIVDDCMVLTRRRDTGREERFSTPRQVALVNNILATLKRKDAISTLFAAFEKSELRREEP